jgi:hypothetical protein
MLLVVITILMRSGIHGRPYTPWDDVPQTPGAPIFGYCSHSKFSKMLDAKGYDGQDTVATVKYLKDNLL